MSDAIFDVIVIGGGIAGAGCAAALSETRRVLLLEREAHPGYHSTGRSAALFLEAYGNEQVRALSRASRAFFYEAAPEPLVRRRGALLVATESQRPRIAELMADKDFARTCRVIDGASAVERFPLLRGEEIVAALVDEDCADIDVDALLQGYLRHTRHGDGRVLTDAAVLSLEHHNGLWRAGTAAGVFEAPVVVNAAGAWADEVAAMAGLGPMGLVARKRTAAIVPAPDGLDVDRLPMLIDIDEQFYLKPDAGRLLLSPADETPVEPCDAYADDMDVAIAVHRVEAVTHLKVERVIHSWAGLRTFAADRSPVVGFDPRANGFFWLAGQGGYGIQTAPALSDLAARLILDGRAPQRLIDLGLTPDRIAPERLLPPAAPQARAVS